MGRSLEEYRILASLSSHNSEQDEIDEQLWEEVKRRIREIIEDPRYESINLMD